MKYKQAPLNEHFQCAAPWIKGLLTLLPFQSDQNHLLRSVFLSLLGDTEQEQSLRSEVPLPSVPMLASCRVRYAWR